MGINHIVVESELGRDVYDTEALVGANTYYQFGKRVRLRIRDPNRRDENILGLEINQNGRVEVYVIKLKGQDGREYRCTCRRVADFCNGETVRPEEIFEEIKDNDGNVISKRIIARWIDGYKSS